MDAQETIFRKEGTWEWGFLADKEDKSFLFSFPCSIDDLSLSEREGKRIYKVLKQYFEPKKKER